MPLPLLFALFIAFGFDPVSPEGATSALAPLSGIEVLRKSLDALGGIVTVGATAYLFGLAVAARVNRGGRATWPTSEEFTAWAATGSTCSACSSLVSLSTCEAGRESFARVSLWGDPILIDDALILLPFLIIQLAGWWGLYAAERALREPRAGRSGQLGGVGRFLWLKSRQSLGMVLPVAVVYGLGTDIIHRGWPSTAASPWDQPLGLIVMGVLVLLAAPALIRLAWPTRPLPPGPLRSRLEHVADRVGFRCTDILVWDTSGLLVNAGVTGSLPWFRYVFLTGTLIEELNPHEVSAVFGHEIGHIAHRHLVYFGFFVLASLGVLALASGAINQVLAILPLPETLSPGTNGSLVLEACLTLLVIGAYFFFVFGYLSRRFEGQADVFGCKVVSCGQLDCPPHSDLDGPLARNSPIGERPPMPLCPVGIRIFIIALENVAKRNGMKPRAWSWRHGSIVRRIAFLEGLIQSPDAERRFQLKVRRMRWVLGLILLTGAASAVLLSVE